MKEHEAARTAQKELENYKRLGEDTKKLLSESIPGIIHIIYLAGYELVPRLDA